MRQAFAFWSTRSRNARLALVTLLCLAVIGAGVAIAPRLTHASGGPTISGFAPASGPLRTIVTVNGSGLLFTSGVTIGGVSASFRIHTNSWLDVRVPDSSQTGAIVVTTIGGTATSATDFTISPGLVLNAAALPPLQRIQPIIPTPTAWPGGTVQAQGSGFAPGEMIGFSLDGASLGQTTTADAQGLFANVTLHLPYGIASGGQQARATGQTSALTTQTALSILDIWRQFGHDAAHTSNNANEATISAANVATL